MAQLKKKQAVLETSIILRHDAAGFATAATAGHKDAASFPPTPCAAAATASLISAATPSGRVNQSPRTAVVNAMLAKRRNSETSVRLRHCRGCLTKTCRFLGRSPWKSDARIRFRGHRETQRKTRPRDRKTDKPRSPEAPSPAKSNHNNRATEGPERKKSREDNQKGKTKAQRKKFTFPVRDVFLPTQSQWVPADWTCSPRAVGTAPGLLRLKYKVSGRQHDGRVNDKQLLAHVIVRWLEQLDPARQGTTFPSSEIKRLRTADRDNRCPAITWHWCPH